MGNETHRITESRENACGVGVVIGDQTLDRKDMSVETELTHINKSSSGSTSRGRVPFLISIALIAGLGLSSQLSAQGSASTDTNGDGLSDVDNILDEIDRLKKVGVVFDDEDSQGHIPIKRGDGLYHMACVDLILVAYRAAGYDLCRALGGGRLERDKAEGLYKKGDHGGSARLVVNLVAYVKKSPAFTYYDVWGTSPLDEPWYPEVPFQVGDILFLHYTDSKDRHSCIVTDVDDQTGLPTRVANISAYNPGEDLQEIPFEALFQLYCRRISGYVRPTVWNTRDS